MPIAQLQDRLEELRRLIAERDLSRATRRMLDLFADATLPVSLRKPAIRLRAAYNAYAIAESSAATGEQYDPLLEEAVRLIGEVESFFKKEYPEAFPAAQPVASPSPAEAGPAVFQGRGITKVFRTPRYTFELPELDLNLRLGEITGIVGENGNGKTTLLRIVAGEPEPSAGELHYPLFDAAPGDWYHIKQHIAYIPQQLPVWRGFLKENLHFTAAIHGIKGMENEDPVDFIIHRLRPSQYEGGFWSEISSGYKLRFELARALVWRPRRLIIDEPLGNLDIHTQQIFLQDLRYLVRSSRHPMAILLSSQHLHEVESIADNIIFIKNGEAIYNGRMRDFGSDRNENLYELSTAASKSEILDRLRHLPHLLVEDAGQVKVIRTPVGMDANGLLGELVRAGIPVNYFRDISTSTLKLFRRGNGAPASLPRFPDE